MTTICQHCHLPIDSAYKTRKYHIECAVIAKKEKNREFMNRHRAYVVRNCLICGAELTGTRNKKVCRGACARILNNRNQLEYKKRHPEIIKKNTHDYYMRNKARISEYKKKLYETDKK